MPTLHGSLSREGMTNGTVDRLTCITPTTLYSNRDGIILPTYQIYQLGKMTVNISIPRRIKLSSEVLYQELKDEAVLLDLASEQYFGLDSVGTRIWQLLTDNGDTEYVISQMLQEYDVDEATLRCDVAAFIEKLDAAGLIKTEPKS